MTYAITLDRFEGPLDLLLHLIQKNKIDIYDIPIAQITGQYLDQIRQWQELDLDVASEFIVMASRLLEIKSRMLLPITEHEEESAEDLQAVLVNQLLDYQVFKRISVFLEEREMDELGSMGKEPEYIPGIPEQKVIELRPERLEKAFKRIMATYRDDHTLNQYAGEIQRDNFTVEEKIELVKHCLQTEKRYELLFSHLLSGNSRAEIIATFQALLEMYKLNQITIVQQSLFSEIIVRQGIEVDGTTTNINAE